MDGNGFLTNLPAGFPPWRSAWLPRVQSLQDWLSAREPIPESLEPIRSTLEAAALLGTRTAELHLALASSSTVAAFAPEPLTGAELANDAERIESQIKSAFEALKFSLPKLDDATVRSGGPAAIPPARTHSAGTFDSIGRNRRATHPNSRRLSSGPDIADSGHKQWICRGKRSKWRFRPHRL